MDDTVPVTDVEVIGPLEPMKYIVIPVATAGKLEPVTVTVVPGIANVGLSVIVGAGGANKLRGELTPTCWPLYTLT